MDQSYLIMLTTKELVIAGIVVAILILAVIIGKIVSSGKKKRAMEKLEEEADFYYDMYYSRMVKEAEAKYKVYESKGYHDRLPNPMEALGKEKEMRKQLNETDSFNKKKTILEAFLPNILLALVRCREEGADVLPQKEATQIKKLMKEYGVK